MSETPDVIVAEPIAWQPRDEYWLGLSTAVAKGNREWLSGTGRVPADVMFVGTCPGRQEHAARSAACGPCANVLRTKLQELGMNGIKAYFTFAVKHNVPKIGSKELRMFAPYLAEEILRVRPRVIVCLGKDALTAVMGKAEKFSVVRGTRVPYPGVAVDVVKTIPETWDDDGEYVPASTECETVTVSLPGTFVFPVFNPAFLDIAPDENDAFDRELKTLRSLMQGEEQNLQRARGDWVVVNKAADIKAITDSVLTKPALGALDCEWHGESWYKPDAKIRTVQLRLREPAVTFVFEFTKSVAVENGYENVDAMDDPSLAWRELKQLLEHRNCKLIGHNIKEDGLWLIQNGIDIRANVIWDTMLAEHLMNQSGPFGLEELALKYTDIPRWAVELEHWKQSVGSKWHGGGYGYVPAEILNPYAVTDVVATLAIFEKQAPLMTEYLQPRGKYPSLFDSVIQAQNLMYEIERTGLPVDTNMLDRMIGLFEPKVKTMQQDLQTAAAKLGMPAFNPDSSKDVTELLFKKLAITPFRTTKKAGGKLWQDAMQRLSIDDVAALAEIAPATDALSLTILADEHEMVKSLLDYRRVSQIRKTWLRWPEADGSGGLYGCLGPDKRLHPRFSFLTETGRYRTAAPNSQNFPKKAQKFLDDIFAAELKSDPWLIEQGGMPSIRQIVAPPEGYVIIEGDFVQAELFTMAALSNDERMWKALTTPGLDLHDKTAIDGFGIKVLSPDGHEVQEAEILERALEIWTRCGGGGAEFDKRTYEKELDGVFAPLIYLDQTGRRMTRKQFKSTARVSAKAINFG